LLPVEGTARIDGNRPDLHNFGVAAPAAKRERPLVLVTEDVTDARELFQFFLEAEGFEVVTASNGREAVARAQEISPDVVVMDLSMPVMDGFSATEELKNNALTKDIPVVALSGHVMPQHKSRAREAGCDTMLPKPSPLGDVAAKIRGMLHPAKARR
jgi:CheY-like chemotaxis protein